MTGRRFYALGSIAAVGLVIVWGAIARTARDASDAKRDAMLRDLARVVSVHEVHKLHWKILETSKDFTTVIDQLSQELIPEKLSVRWTVTVLAASKLNQRDPSLDDFERLALAAIQGGQDEPSLISEEPVLRYARAVRAKTSCIACHASTPDGAPVKENDVIGVVLLKMHARTDGSN